MNIKNKFKRILSILLLTTSLCTNVSFILPNNILTFAETDIEQNQDIENITIGKCLFVHVKDTPFYIRSNIYDEKLHSKSALKQIYKNAKEKISNVLDLDYPDELEIKIQVFNTNEFYDKLDAIFYGKRFFWFDNSKKLIQIKNECLADNQTLPHEMVHSFLWYKLGDFNNLNQNLNEGLATQMQDLNRWKKQSDFLGHENACFDSEIINYPLHQHIVHDWIESEGKDVVKKFIEKVKNGEDSVQAFLKLGGDKIVKKYNGTIVHRSKFAKKLKKTLLCILFYPPFILIRSICCIFRGLNHIFKH